ncbi:hypothetical protein PHMEG_00030654 [Phytophthora megakarya]|uniref:Uncharacterized protein n=1 Tax=Phytophthora megakarya TaxID=4795 RepID=A0A225V056_9STRA|nr:hypothetical protein PHMEG_00030654 [Phytophthora megakarya]
MPKLRGTRNYNLAEQDRLLAIVSAELPHGPDDWGVVAVAFNAALGPLRKSRSGISLRRKFMSLCREAQIAESESGDSRSLSTLAAELKLKINARGKYNRGVPDSRAQEVPSPPLDTLPERLHLESEDVVASRQRCAGYFATSVVSCHRHDDPESTRTLAAEGSSSTVGGAEHTTASQASCLQDSQVTGSMGHTLEESVVWSSLLSCGKRHSHCDIARLLFMCFQQREQQQHAEWQNAQKRDQREKDDNQRQRDQERVDANQRHKELLACLASLQRR